MFMMLRALPILAVAMLAASAALAQDQATFPITLEHALGTITIPAEPQRVIALMDRDVDTVLALGVQPVAVRSLYGFEKGVGPWAEPLLGDAPPQVWIGRDFNFEAIAAMKPDLIIYANSGGETDIYQTLSQIAPTVGLPSGATAWQATPQQTTRLIAKALGRDAQGEALLTGLDSYLAARKAEYPAFSGKTFNYLDIYPGGIASYSQNHIVNAMGYAVGFSPIAKALDIPAGQSSVTVSTELLSSYDADVLLIYPFGRTLDVLEAETPTLANLPSMKAGRAFVLDDLAFSTASVLSIPYALDRLLPKISTALAQ